MSKDTTIRAHLRAQAALDRAEYFARPGATAADWRGGRRQVHTDRRKERSRRACRGRVDARERER